MDQFLYDRLAKPYPRKNQYLDQLAVISNDMDKKKIKEFKKHKNTHPYIILLKDYNSKELDFKKALKRKIKTFKNTNKKLSKRVRYLNIRLIEAQEKLSFYSQYVEFCYDAEYYTNVSKLEVNELPKAIEHITTLEKATISQRALFKGLNKSDYKDIKEDLKLYKSTTKEEIKEKIDDLKIKYKNKLISRKAYKNTTLGIKRNAKENYKVKSYALPTILEKNKLRNMKFDSKSEYKKELAYINENISEIRRNTPYEKEENKAVNYLGLLVPGLTQIINGQIIKGRWMLLLSAFIYGVAIPYALGFGNYRGQGVSGLINLAEGAPKLDRSIIFMIEGIIAIFLLAIAVGAFIVSYKDGKKVFKEKQRGIRPNNWYESKIILSEQGFPFVVTLPALITIIFIVIVPITTAVLLSFTGMDPSHQAKFSWVGFENYKLLFTGTGIIGGPFWKITSWTVIWTLTSSTLAIFIGFALALILNNDRIKFKRLFRSIYLLPWAVPAFITILFFSILFGARGTLTDFLGGIQVKNSTTLARITLILMQGWLGSAYIFLLSTGVLQSIPGDLYEAADIDGSTKWQKLRRITIPMVLFQTAPLLVGQYVFNFNNFSIIYLFNGGGPYNPGVYGNFAGTTDLLISYVYKLTMEQQYQSAGAAVIFVVSLALMVFAFIGFVNSKAFKEERL